MKKKAGNKLGYSSTRLAFANISQQAVTGVHTYGTSAANTCYAYAPHFCATHAMPMPIGKQQRQLIRILRHNLSKIRRASCLSILTFASLSTVHLATTLFQG
jgi:hypothetical protein